MPHKFIRAFFDELPASVAASAILAGGALRAFYDGSEVKDYDLFFRTNHDYCLADLALAAAGWERVPNPNSNANNFRAPSGKLVNLVGFAFGTAAEQIERFDFRCCALSAWLSDSIVCTLNDPAAIDDAEEKLLVVRNNNGTERTMKRIAHYVEDYGYTVVIPEETPEIAAALDEADRLDATEVFGAAPVIEYPQLTRIAKPLRRHLRTLPRGTAGDS